MLKNLKIRTKLFWSFGIVIFLLIGAMLISLVSLTRLADNMKTYTDNIMPLLNASWVGKRAMTTAEKTLGVVSSTTDIDKIEKALTEADEQMKLMQTEVLSVYEMRYDAKREDIDELRTLLNDATIAKNDGSSLIGQGKNTEAISNIKSNFIPKLLKLSTQFSTVMEGIETRASTFADKSKATNKRAEVILILIAAISTLLSCSICILIARSIVLPLKEISKAASEMDEGNFNIEIDYHSKDDIGQVCEKLRSTVASLGNYISQISVELKAIASGTFELNKNLQFKGDFAEIKDSIDQIVISLSNALGKIGQSAEQVATGSGQVAAGAQSLSEGTTNQANSIEQLVATVGNISEQITKNAEHAKEASGLANKTGADIQKNDEQMQEMITSIHDITEKSTQISKIIRTIDDIAFQTNILALNAAVEAARAGSAGKGFAVVADEVRNLASRSAEAAESTAVLIEESIRAVDKGTKIADKTAKSLKETVIAAKNTGEIIAHIAEVSNSQASSIERVLEEIELISSVVQTNSATAEESAATSQELSSQSQFLRDMVGNFKLIGQQELDVKAPQDTDSDIKVLQDEEIPIIDDFYDEEFLEESLKCELEDSSEEKVSESQELEV